MTGNQKRMTAKEMIGWLSRAHAALCEISEGDLFSLCRDGNAYNYLDSALGEISGVRSAIESAMKRDGEKLDGE